MGDRTGQRNRLNYFQKLLRKSMDSVNILREFFPNGRRDVPLSTFLGSIECHPQSLKMAAEFFKLDYKDPYDLSLLAHILAETIFGSSARGRKKGDKIWTSQRLLALASKYFELKSQNPKFNDTKIADLISQDGEFREYRNNPELIRQRLSKARHEDWLEYKREEWAAERPEEFEDASAYGWDDGKDDHDY